MARVNRTTGVFLVLGVVVLIVSVSAAWFMESQGHVPAVDKQEPLEDSLDIWGGGEVDVRTGISEPPARLPGIVTSVEVKVGDKVTAGQVLLRLDDTNARNELNKLKDALEVAKSEVDQAQLAMNQRLSRIAEMDEIVSAHRAAYDEAMKVRDRAIKAKDATADGEEKVTLATLAVNQAAYKWKAATIALDALKKNPMDFLLTAAQKKVKGLENQVKASEDTLVREYVVRAPKNGRIFSLHVNVGEQIGMPSPRVAPPIQFCPDDELIVRAQLDQSRAFGVRVGQKVIVHMHGSVGGKSWEGKVESVSPWVHQKTSRFYEPDQINDARVRECIIRFDKQPSEDELVVGTRLHVQIKK